METTIGDDEAITLNSQRGLSAQNSMPRASRQAGTVEIQKQARHHPGTVGAGRPTTRAAKIPTQVAICRRLPYVPRTAVGEICIIIQKAQVKKTHTECCSRQMLQ
jgi:hypothetical protein